MSGLGRLLAFMALDASSSQDREEAWRKLHRRPDAPPLSPEPARARSGWRRWAVGWSRVAWPLRRLER